MNPGIFIQTRRHDDRNHGFNRQFSVKEGMGKTTFIDAANAVMAVRDRNAGRRDWRGR